jgi:Ankyrin repeats (3 copies)
MQYSCLTTGHVDYTARATLKELVLTEFPNPHSLPAAVCMTLLTRHGFQSMGRPSEDAIKEMNDHPLLHYAHEAWASHALASIDDDAIKNQLAAFVQGCSAFPILLSGWGGWFDVLSPLHVAAYFNLPISLAGQHRLQEPNQLSLVERLTPLSLATLVNSERAVGELLALPKVDVNATGICKATPLVLASTDNREGIVKLLLAHPKVDVNCLALMKASFYGCTGVVRLLLLHPDLRINKTGPTPQRGAVEQALLQALAHGHEGVAKLLLAHPGVDVNVEDRYGKEVLKMALKSGCRSIVQLLLARRDIENQVCDDIIDVVPSTSRGGSLISQCISSITRCILPANTT